jgi:2-polyprenyl-6-methoxyphenol hydroxylase-like FAD-dependent oxidoreductase
MAASPGTPLKVVVVGAGIGGLATALALTRAGIDVTVLEQTPELSELGAQFSIGPNATRLLGALGLLKRLRVIGVRPEVIEHLRWNDGRVLLSAPFGAEGETFFGAPQLDFLRSDLQRGLAAELPAAVVRTGAKVAALEQDGDRVDAVLDSGERVRANAAVAADGIRSGLRQDLAGADTPRFSGTVVYRGLIRRELAVPFHPELAARFWVGPERHGVVYWVASGRLAGIAAAVRRAEWSRESWTDPGDPAEMLAAFEGWHPALLGLMRNCHTLIRSPVFVREPLERWSYGHVTLLGDAAHAMEPFNAQGAAQAIEDAFVLAECLAGTGPGEVAEALARYERVRTVRAAELQTASAAAAHEFYLPDGPAQRERDARYAALRETQPWGLRQPFWMHDVRDDLAGIP